MHLDCCLNPLHTIWNIRNLAREVQYKFRRASIANWLVNKH